MKNIRSRILIIVMLFLGSELYAQSLKDSIYVIKKQKAYFYYQDGKMIRYGKCLRLLSAHKASAYEANKARKKRLAGNLLVVPGGLMAGFFLFGLITGNVENLIPVGAGVVLMIAGTHLKKREFEHAQKAVKLYNSSLSLQ